MKNLGDVFQLSQGLLGHCVTERLAAPFMLSDPAVCPAAGVKPYCARPQLSQDRGRPFSFNFFGGVYIPLWSLLSSQRL